MFTVIFLELLLTRREKIDKRIVDKKISFAFVKHSFSQNRWRKLLCAPHISAQGTRGALQVGGEPKIQPTVWS